MALTISRVTICILTVFFKRDGMSPAARITLTGKKGSVLFEVEIQAKPFHTKQSREGVSGAGKGVVKTG